MVLYFKVRPSCSHVIYHYPASDNVVCGHFRLLKMINSFKIYHDFCEGNVHMSKSLDPDQMTNISASTPNPRLLRIVKWRATGGEMVAADVM